MAAQVTKAGVLNMQVCVPSDWTDEQAIEFAEKEFPCGTTGGWFVTKQGHEWLNGSDERVTCIERPDHVHIMLNA